jgi:hypothetical protein
MKTLYKDGIEQSKTLALKHSLFHQKQIQSIVSPDSSGKIPACPETGKI